MINCSNANAIKIIPTIRKKTFIHFDSSLVTNASIKNTKPATADIPTAT